MEEASFHSYCQGQCAFQETEILNIETVKKKKNWAGQILVPAFSAKYRWGVIGLHKQFPATGPPEERQAQGLTALAATLCRGADLDSVFEEQEKGAERKVERGLSFDEEWWHTEDIYK